MSRFSRALFSSLLLVGLAAPHLAAARPGKDGQGNQAEQPMTAKQKWRAEHRKARLEKRNTRLRGIIPAQRRVVADVAAPAPAATKPTPTVQKAPSFGLFGSRLGSDSWFGGDYEYEPRYKPTPAAFEKLPEHKQQAIRTLLRQTERPTAKQVMAAVRAAYGDETPSENPFGSASHITNNVSEMADMIAQLEYAYPGGTWLPLGRDAVAIADVLDVFYAANGQSNRVRRLDGSGTSFPHYRNTHDGRTETFEKDRPILYKFLTTNGLDLEHVDQKPPFVMIDVTSFSPTSQSTQLMRAAYSTWAAKGKDPAALTGKVAFVGLPMGRARHRISETHDIEAAKAELASETTATGPREILYLGGSLGAFTYTPAWHSDFEDFADDGTGAVRAAPGRQGSDGEKLRVLAELYSIGTLVSKPSFADRVKDTAKTKYHYAFPTERSQTLVRFARPAPTPSMSASAERSSSNTESTIMVALRTRLKPGKLPQNAWDNRKVAAEFIGDMAGMSRRRSFTPTQLAEALALINESVDVMGREFDSQLHDIFRAYPEFKDTFATAMREAQKIAQRR